MIYDILQPPRVSGARDTMGHPGARWFSPGRFGTLVIYYGSVIQTIIRSETWVSHPWKIIVYHSFVQQFRMHIKNHKEIGQVHNLPWLAMHPYASIGVYNTNPSWLSRLNLGWLWTTLHVGLQPRELFTTLVTSCDWMMSCRMSNCPVPRPRSLRARERDTYDTLWYFIYIYI